MFGFDTCFTTLSGTKITKSSLEVNFNFFSITLKKKQNFKLIFQMDSRFKRSPYLRLDELSTKLYLAKNKLGGGYLDPLEM
jgi:hypothetical protein